MSIGALFRMTPQVSVTKHIPQAGPLNEETLRQPEKRRASPGRNKRTGHLFSVVPQCVAGRSRVARRAWRFQPALALACITLIAFLAGCQAPPPAAIFVEQSQRLHQDALALTVITDPDLTDYLQEIGNRIAAVAPSVAPGKANGDFLKSVRCFLVNCDTINAFNTGGPDVYIYNGLFQQCQSEEELAAVVAHAYAHLINRDLEATRMRPDPKEPLSMTAWQFVINRFTLQQEERADALAVALYAKAGWDPNHFPFLFEHLESVSGGIVAVDRQALPSRVGTLQSVASDAARTGRILPVADPRTYLSLQRRAGNIHEPPGPPVPQIYLRAFPNCILSGDTPEQRQAQERLRPAPPKPNQTIEPS
ncbi:MAG TPA: M48 family metalloprotease [Tepidisphaeraceae bacterium]|nr:M48 family metalloprotease [Tepidisphaeraceae bacterium]